MGPFYALLGAVVITTLAVLITFAALTVTGNYTGTLKRGQAKPQQPQQPKPPQQP